MSRKSATRISSGGDVETLSVSEDIPNEPNSTVYEGFVRSPFGDQSGCNRDVFILMYRNGQSTETSEGDDDLMRNVHDQNRVYMEKLNCIRRRLNLTEIEDRNSSGGCKITEIEDDSAEDSQNEKIKTCIIDGSKPKVGDDEIKTIKPFTMKYKTESAEEIMDLEYNPPKKMSCYRLQTPKVNKTSESNIPYHIKVSLNENLFKTRYDKMSSEMWREAVEKFTSTKEVQCDSEEFDNKEDPYKFKTNIITKDYTRVVRSNDENHEQTSLFPQNFLMNCVETLTETRPVSSTTTITSSPKSERKRKTAWDDLSRITEETNTRLEGGGDDIPKKKVRKSKKYWKQYLTYRRDRNQIKSAPVRCNRENVIFGPVVVRENDMYNLDNNFYLYTSSSEKDSTKSTERNSFWSGLKRLFCCFKND